MFALKHWICAATIAAMAPLALAQTSPQTPDEAPAPLTESANDSQAQVDVTTEAVKQRFSEAFGNMPVDAVRRGPFNLFEVQIGDSLVYTDESVTFVFDGRLIDVQTRQDLTQARLEELARIDFDALPLDLAIIQVRGDGARKMAIFEDPNCGFCKQMRRSMQDIDNVTVYTYLLPILSDDSRDKVRDVWCADDPGQVWDAWMLQNEVPATKQCDAPIEEMIALARQLGVQGTPATFFADGSRVPGAISEQEIEARLQ